MHMRGKTICEFTVIIEYPGFEADLGFELNLGSLEQRSLSRSLRVESRESRRSAAEGSAVDAV